ncbi:MAG TPA: hypothetical protein VMB26_09170 [Candidatus Binataceae bacterium]|nr:hypothetical protein [Candidatus Binataceae bacterium]
MDYISREHRADFSSRYWPKVVIALIFSISCGLAQVHSAAAQSVPTGTIELSGGSVAAGIGYTWGHGKLVFEGRTYRLKVSGLSIVHVGVSSYTASGTVYDLKKVSDIAGVYTAVSAGAAVAGGASVTAMKNDKGVTIQMVSTHSGVNFSLGPKGVTISLER